MSKTSGTFWDGVWVTVIAILVTFAIWRFGYQIGWIDASRLICLSGDILEQNNPIMTCRRIVQ